MTCLLKLSDHPPALDVCPRAGGRDDARAAENKFDRVEPPSAFLGNALQPPVIGRPGRLPTGFVHRIEEADVRWRGLDCARDQPQVRAKRPQVGRSRRPSSAPSSRTRCAAFLCGGAASGCLGHIPRRRPRKPPIAGCRPSDGAETAPSRARQPTARYPERGFLFGAQLQPNRCRHHAAPLVTTGRIDGCRWTVETGPVIVSGFGMSRADE